ncbi:hypothetical protein Alg215_12468, partial [Pyrenophora tritici-repentis]
DSDKVQQGILHSKATSEVQAEALHHGSALLLDIPTMFSGVSAVSCSAFWRTILRFCCFNRCLKEPTKK